MRFVQVLVFAAALAIALAGIAAEPPTSPPTLESLWDELANPDAGRAWAAVWALAERPAEAVPFLRERVKPITPPPTAKDGDVDRLIRELGDDDFRTRERAEADLMRLGAPVRPALARVLAITPCPETAFRLRWIVGMIDMSTAKTSALRERRALAVLEEAGTPDAVAHLRALAAGLPASPLTRDARAALARLGR